MNKPPNEVLFIGTWEALKISLSGENLRSGGPGDVAFLIFVSRRVCSCPQELMHISVEGLLCVGCQATVNTRDKTPDFMELIF